MSKTANLEEEFFFLLKISGIPLPERQYVFLPDRKYRFDFAWPDVKVYVEIEGGIWIQGRHVRPQGYARDCEKYNLAALAGWVGLRFTSDMIHSQPAQCVEKIAALLEQRGLEISLSWEVKTQIPTH